MYKILLDIHITYNFGQFYEHYNQSINDNFGVRFNDTNFHVYIFVYYDKYGLISIK